MWARFVKLPVIFDLLGGSAEEAKESSHLGIGLYIAREIVEAHSGKIIVTSTAQDGTTFVVRLPRQKESSGGGGSLHPGDRVSRANSPTTLFRPRRQLL